MKILAHLATNQFISTRLSTISGYKQDFSTVTGFLGNVQPASPQKTELFNGVMGKTYVIFVDGTIDIQEGDRLRDTDTDEIYQVVNGGASRRTHGIVDFYEVIVQHIS